VPFSIGVSNGANEIWPVAGGVGGIPSLPDGSSLLIWNGHGYITYLSDSGSPSSWDDAGGDFLPGAPTLPVGQGFFLIPAASTTNTFVGTVAVNVGATNNTSYLGGNTYFVAPVVPYGGTITNGSSTGGGVALSAANNLPDGSSLLVWNGSGYITYLSDSGSGSLWDDAGGDFLPTAPSVSVGQGFFIIPAANFTWTEGLSAQ
jgi:hypothetical protein